MRKTCALLISGIILSIATPAALQADTFDVTVAPGGARMFDPSDIIIDIGDTVRWTWGATGHNVRSGIPGSPTPYFFSGAPAPIGTVFEFTFDQPFLDANPVPGNVYDYFCEPHGALGMVGSVTVVPEPAALMLLGLVAAAPLLRRRRAR